MPISSLDELYRAMAEGGVERLYVKPLAENDNFKQGIYFGGGFATLQHLPIVDVERSPKSNALWAFLPFFWLTEVGATAHAPETKLILYGQYPEVRLSGFMAGCANAPVRLLQPLKKEQRKFGKGPDGRMLFLGVTRDRRVIGFLAAAGEVVARAARALLESKPLARLGVFYTLPLVGTPDPRGELLRRLREIHQRGKIDSSRLSGGVVIPYSADCSNSAGYTLEAALGIAPNGRSAPDFMGWEVKSFSNSPISLMTPEPDGGLYGSSGIAAFLAAYGHPHRSKAKTVFTGRHKAGQRLPASGMTLQIVGFDQDKGKIFDFGGAVELHDSAGRVTASWSFAKLSKSWSTKHSQAVYVPRTAVAAPPPSGFRFNSPVLIGEGTDFELFLQAMSGGSVFYDPGMELAIATGKPKPRSQFRASSRNLAPLYRTFTPVAL